jgi:3-deoxy-7-phosphoheptulonate synthase
MQGETTMMVVMKKDHAPQNVDAVLSYLQSASPRSSASACRHRRCRAIYPELSEELRGLPGVDETVPISKPYKLASRELKPQDTVVKVGNVEIGGGSTVVIAGQCSVDTPDQMLATAQVVKGRRVLRGGAFRGSPHAFRGLVDGAAILAEAGAAYSLPTVAKS